MSIRSPQTQITAVTIVFLTVVSDLKQKDGIKSSAFRAPVSYNRLLFFLLTVLVFNFRLHSRSRHSRDSRPQRAVILTARAHVESASTPPHVQDKIYDMTLSEVANQKYSIHVWQGKNNLHEGCTELSNTETPIRIPLTDNLFCKDPVFLSILLSSGFGIQLVQNSQDPKSATPKGCIARRWKIWARLLPE